MSYIVDKWKRKDGKEREVKYTTFEVYKDMLLFLSSNVGCRWGDMIKMKVSDIVYDDKTDPVLGYKKRYNYLLYGKNKTTKGTR